MQHEASSKYSGLKDLLNVVGFVIAVIVGAWLINLFVFRSFSVSGPSMEPTFYTNDRLIVDRLPVTWAHLRGSAYVPQRGQIIVFKNPLFEPGMEDEYVVKRVIGFPGERVVVKNGTVRVYNNQYPNGLDVDSLVTGPTSPTDNDTDQIVTANHLFVMGDHRQAGYSLDSRDGLGQIPYDHLIGPVSLRIFPFTKIDTF